MSNRIELDLQDYTTDYFNNIRELIVQNFQLIVFLSPLKEVYEESNQYEVTKESVTIGKFHTNLFANLINDLKFHIIETNITSGRISLKIEPSAINFDVAIIGIIAVFKRSFPKIKFDVFIPKEIAAEPFYKFRDILFSLRNWYQESDGVHLFSIYYSGKLNVRFFNEPRGLLPIVLLTQDSYHKYFSQKSNGIDFANLFNKINKTEILSAVTTFFSNHNRKGANDSIRKTDPSIAEINYRIIRDTVNHFKGRLEWKDNQRAFFQHYILMLSNFDLLVETIAQVNGYDFSSIPFKSFRKVNLSTEDMKRLQSAVKLICAKLSDEPLFLTLVFSVLVNRNIDKQINNVRNYIQRLNELFEYSSNLFLGIKEIARNIIDHTETKIGVICGKELSGETLYQINNDLFVSNDSKLNKYFENLSFARIKLLTKNIYKEPFLQITIFDEGQQGIILKTIENIKSLIGKIEDKEHLFSKDLINLNSNKIKFFQFFNTKEFQLSHQSYKASSHWGLVSFTNLINRNFGLITASSKSNFNSTSYDKCLAQLNETEEITFSKNDFTFGTKFEIVLPIGKAIPLGKNKLSNISPKGVNFSAENYLKLFNFEFIDEQEQISNSEINYLFKVDIKKYLDISKGADYRKEYNLAENIGKYIREIYEKNKNIIPVLDFENTYEFIDHSKILRFLGALQLELEIDSLIIVNVKSEIVIGLNTIMNLSDSKMDNVRNWNQDHFILIYSYSEDQDKNRMYYTDILGGATFKEYKLLKNKLSSTHSTIINYKFSVGNSVFSKETKLGFGKSHLFVEDTGIVKNFEMLIMHNKKSLFESSLIYNLNTKIQEVQYGYSGYKIENSHFKLGSKTHIKDFIYAKRIFQNSFFTDRFAFLISKYYLSKYPNKKSLTIIGYGEYSQMLINRIEKILKVYFKTDNINHNMVSDAEKPYFINNESFNENLLVIVPINTTLSTTIKIEDLVYKKINDENKINFCKLLTPSLNLILVTHKDLENFDYVNSLNDFLNSSNTDGISDFPYKFFYWKNVNIKDKIILLGTNPQKGTTREEKYFVSLKSEWYLPEKCESCFPKWDTRNQLFKDGIYYEKPLLETDKTSVTPDLLLDLPASFSLSNNYKEEDIFINEKSYLVNHRLYKNNHYQHFIDPFPFFSFYKDKIEAWASSWRDELFKCLPELFDSSILLIAPSERNNTYFIELINRIIFNDSAVIIHYEVSGDYTENYQKFFSANVKQSNYIFYIDDIIQSGKTFHLVNNFIRYCNNLEGFEIKDKVTNKTCDGVFTLISKTDIFAKSDIVTEIYSNQKINDNLKYNAFFYLSVNSIINEKCPICIEQKKYLTLAENSLLDTVKHYFLNKSKNLISEEENNSSSSDNGWFKYHPLVAELSILPWLEGANSKTKDYFDHYKEINLPKVNYLKLLIQHLINNILSSNNEIRRQLEFDFQSLDIEQQQKYIKTLFQNIVYEIKNCHPFKEWYNNFNINVSQLYDVILEEILIKTLTVPPFSNIRFVKEKTFFWLTIALDNCIDEFILKKKLEFSKFRKIKFLIKRLSVLGSNHIIRKNALLKFRDIFQIYTSEAKSRIEYRRKQQLLLLDNEFAGFEKIETELSTEYDKLSELSFNVDLIQQSEILVKTNEILKKLKELNYKKQYIIQAIRNIHYIEVSLQEFSYFFVAVVKELTLNSDYKILKLEQNINQILPLLDINIESEYDFLLRSIKYENVSLIKKALDILYGDFLYKNTLLYFNNKFSQVEVRRLLDEKFSIAIEDYRLSSFKQYLGIEDISLWKDANQIEYLRILQLLYLYSCLLNENDVEFEKPSDFKLENKTKAILQNFFRIASDNNYDKHNISTENPIEYFDNKENGAFLVLKYTESSNITDPNHLIVAYATKPYKLEEDYEILNAPFDKESLSLLMINGINRRNDFVYENVPNVINWINKQSTINKELDMDIGYPKKPWTIWEISKNDQGSLTDWQSNRGTIYPLNTSFININPILKYDEKNKLSISNDFTENLYLSDSIKSIGFIRLSDVSLKQNKIKYNNKAIIALFSDQKYFDINRLKLVLILIPQIADFFIKHYDSDSLKAFIEERNEKIEVKRLKHGFQRYLATLKEQALLPSDEKADPEFVNVIYNLLFPWPTLKTIISDYKKILTSNSEPFKFNPSIVTNTINDLFIDISRVFQIIVRNEIGGNGKADAGSFIDCSAQFDVDKSIKVSLSLPIFEVIIAEAIINAKKNRHNESQYILTCHFFSNESGLLMLELTNYCNKNEDKFIKRLNKQNKNNKHGLGLINNISMELFNIPITVKTNENPSLECYEFHLCFPLAKIVL